MVVAEARHVVRQRQAKIMFFRHVLGAVRKLENVVIVGIQVL